MDWKLDFISEDDFVKHVEATIDKYGEKLESFDIKRFNKNIIDPIKLIFDKTVYQSTWEEMVGNEIFRQRDKSNNNDIGYFHQTIFQYMNNCRVPDNGKEGGWCCLDNYSADYVCTNLIYQEALDNVGKPDRRTVNEINDIMNNSIVGWKQKTGATKRFEKYGIQKYWYREEAVNKEFVSIPKQMEIPFDSRV